MPKDIKSCTPASVGVFLLYSTTFKTDPLFSQLLYYFCPAKIKGNK